MDDAQAARDQGFEAFYRANFGAIARTARAITGPAAADDIAQDALMVALRSWSHVQSLDVPCAWVRLVARRMAHRHVWREVRRPAFEAVEAADAATVNALAVSEIFSSMTARDQAALAMHYLDDLSIAAVGERLSCSPSAAKALMMRAREHAAPAASGLHGRWCTERTWTRDSIARHLRGGGSEQHASIVIEKHLGGIGGKWLLTLEENGGYELHRDDGVRLDFGQFRHHKHTLEFNPAPAPGVVTFDVCIDGDQLGARLRTATTPATDGVPDTVWMNLFMEASTFTWSGRQRHTPT